MNITRIVPKTYSINLRLQKRCLCKISITMHKVTKLNNLLTTNSCILKYKRCEVLVPSYNFATRPPRRNAEKIRFTAENRAKAMWISFTIVAVFVVVFTLSIKHWKKKQDKLIVTNKVKSFGTPAIGGDFELIDCDGKLFSNKDLLGNWALIYFGFTNCPDICPEELEKLGNAVNITNRNIARFKTKLQPVFISIDPDRDTPEAIRNYLSDFHPDFIGLSGTKDQIETATRAFRVYYSKPPSADDDYIMDHTVVMYLLDDEGQFNAYFMQDRSAGEMASSITSSCAAKEAEKIKNRIEDK